MDIESIMSVSPQKYPDYFAYIFVTSAYFPRKKNEGEVLIATQPITLLQIFYVFQINSDIIFKYVLMTTSSRSRVAKIFLKLFCTIIIMV